MNSRFSQGLKGLGNDDTEQRTSSSAVQPMEPEKRQPISEDQESGRYTAPSRRGKKAVTGYYDPAVRQQLAVLAAEEDRSQNDLLAEALNMLFERYRKSPIAKG